MKKEDIKNENTFLNIPFAFDVDRTGVEPGSGMNQAPVGPESRALSEPAGECESPASGALSSFFS